MVPTGIVMLTGWGVPALRTIIICVSIPTKCSKISQKIRNACTRCHIRFGNAHPHPKVYVTSGAGCGRIGATLFINKHSNSGGWKS